MQLIAASASCCLSVSVCLLVTTASRAKTAGPLEMALGAWTWMGQRNPMLVGGPDSPPQWKGRLGPVMQLFVEIL